MSPFSLLLLLLAITLVCYGLLKIILAPKKFPTLEEGLRIKEACKEGDQELIESFVKSGYTMNFLIDGRTPFHYACVYNRETKLAEFLLKNGSSINHSSHGLFDHSITHSNSPLHHACRIGRFDLVNFLIENGANVNIQGSGGQSPIFEPCLNGEIDIVRALLDNGADVNYESWWDKRPIDLVERENEDLLKLLVERGARMGPETKKKPFLVYLLNSKQRCLLLCTRKFCPYSVFGEENLPMDLFKFILFLSNFVTKDPFLVKKKTSLEKSFQ